MRDSVGEYQSEPFCNERSKTHRGVLNRSKAVQILCPVPCVRGTPYDQVVFNEIMTSGCERNHAGASSEDARSTTRE